jgi:hypothetical protein
MAYAGGEKNGISFALLMLSINSLRVAPHGKIGYRRIPTPCVNVLIWCRITAGLTLCGSHAERFDSSNQPRKNSGE